MVPRELDPHRTEICVTPHNSMVKRDRKPLTTRSNRASIATVSSQPLPLLLLIFIVNDTREEKLEREHDGSITLS